MSNLCNLNSIDLTKVENFAYYKTEVVKDDSTGAFSDKLVLQNNSTISFPLTLNDKKELWIFFNPATEFVAAEITADWSEIQKPPMGIVSGGNMHAFQNYTRDRLPQTKNSHHENLPNQLSKTELMMSLNDSKSLVLNGEGIAAVMITVMELGDVDNSIQVNDVRYNKLKKPGVPGTPTID